MIRKGIQIKQHDITDCGAACLASISVHYGLRLSIAKIRQIASTDKKGTNVLGLIEAANKLGFTTKAVKSVHEDGTIKIAPLYKIPKPTIAHVVVNGKLQHYVVLYEIKRGSVKLMDPAMGKIEEKKIEDFAKEWTGILLLLLPGDEFKAGNEHVTVWQRFLFLMKPHKSIIIQSTFGALIYTILGLAISIYVQKIIDIIIPEENGNLLNLLSIIMLFILLISICINYLKTVFMLKTGVQIDIRLILGYYKHLLNLPQNFFDNMRSGEIISRINDAVKIRSFINETLVALSVNIFTILFAFGLMFTYYWKLAIIMLTIVPLYGFIYYIYNRSNKIIQRKVMESGADLQAQLVESINTIGTIKRFGLEEYSNIKTETRFIGFMGRVYKSAIYSTIASTASESLSKLFTIILLWTGTAFVLKNYITAGELLSFYALIGYFISPMSSLISINRTFQDANIAADRLFEIMDLEIEELDNKIKITREQCGDIIFKNISFRYGTRVEVFKDFTISFPAGKISAIVGESGSGKSTLASLLQNLYPIQSGQILISGIDIKHIANDNLRRLVCVVPQKIDLFEGSIYQNIALDDLAPDNLAIINACKEVGLLDFIEKLPAGFNTNIGENGVQLSGGQRQRLAIARAIYRNPQILILDEATSALDSESELCIKSIVNQMRNKGKTILLIAHRLGTVMNADKIYVLQNGQLMEEGMHMDLLQITDGYYSKFWKNQTQLID